MNIVLVGAGPRNLVLAERLMAYARHNLLQSHTITLVDPYPIGGVVWNPDQNPQFIANTISQQLTLFTDDSVHKKFPGINGPNLYEWAHSEAADYLNRHSFKHKQAFLNEIAILNPNHFASRALFGVYANYFFETLQASATDNVSLSFKQQTITKITPLSKQQFAITDQNQQTQIADAVVYTPGYTPVAPTPNEIVFTQAAQNHPEWHYIQPMQPSLAPLDELPAQQPVLVRGLGLSFFDYMTALTIGRGGQFSRQSNDQLIYHASGNEPHLIAGSRSGTFPHAKAYNQKPNAEYAHAIFFTKANLQKHMINQHITYDAFYQLFEDEMTYKYYFNLMSDTAVNWPFDPAEFLNALRHSHNLTETAKQYSIPANQQINWHQVLNPLAKIPKTYQIFLENYLQADITDAHKGNDLAPYAGAFELLKDLRGTLRDYLEADYLSVDEYEKFLTKFNPINRLLNVGPPVLRLEQLHALMLAGIITITAPNMQVTVTNQGYQANDEQGNQWLANQLVEARLPSISLQHTADPILKQLKMNQVISDVQLARTDGSTFTIDAVNINRKNLKLIDANGNFVPNLYIWGTPTEGWNWFTSFAPRPNVNDKNLRDAETIARTIFE